MAAVIRVRTGARLHFGLLAVQAETGRHFGGVGLMVDAPGCELVVANAERDEILADRELVLRLADWLASFRRMARIGNLSSCFRMEIRSRVPMHAGYGSGTQTALALAAALSRLSAEDKVPVMELARRVGRGARSALGIHGFEHGGLLVEAGKRSPEEISPLVARLAFPSAWRLLLVAPKNGRGLSGESERNAFTRLGSMPAEMTDRLCRIAVMELLPAVAVADFEATSTALHEFGRLNGEYFTSVQGGLFADRRMAEVAAWLIAHGCRGVGQTSWGPTLFALCRDEASALALQRALMSDASWSDLQCLITTARNRGAEVVEDNLPPT